MKAKIRTGTLIALFGCMAVMPSWTHAQDLALLTQLPLNSRQAKVQQLREVLLNVQKQYKINIVFEEDIVKDKNIDISHLKANLSVNSYLECILSGTDLVAKEIRKNVYLVVADRPIDTKSNTRGIQSLPSNAANDLEVLSFPAMKEQNIDLKVSGTVVDEKGETLPGVSIVLKNTTKGTVTNANGSFNLEVPDESATLIFSFVGYLSKEITVGSQTNFKITLATDEKSLQEIVVVGYGTQKKVNVTGAVSQVGAEVLENRAVNNVSQALQGTMPGVTVQASDGRPGATSSIRVRGFSSLNSGGALVIVDGTPGSLNNINPNDIASISVLKDAASAAIYGARGAEGVILVTTKMGQSGKVSIKYQGGVTMLTPTQYPKLAHSYDGATLANAGAQNAGASPFFTEAQIQAMRDPSVLSMPRADGQEWDYVADFDWAGYFLKHAFNQNHNLSITGGSANSKYLISAGWLDQNGYFAKYGPDNFDRYNVRLNLSNELVPSKLTLDTRLSLTSSNTNESSTGSNYIMQSVNQAGRSMPLYNSDGTYARFRMQQNTLQLLEEAGFDKTLNNNIESRVSLGWNITKDLNVKALAGYNVSWNKGTMFGRGYYKYRPATGAGNFGWINKPTQINLNTAYTRYYTGQFLVNYDKTIGKHHFGVFAGTSIESNFYETFGATRYNILGNELPALTLGSTTDAQNSYGGNEWAIVSGFGRLNYDYMNKYLVEANVRADASSRFTQKNRLGVFPSFSAGWRVTEEEFMKSQNLFSNLKIRASYGSVGNQNGLGFYDHIPVYQFSSSLIAFPGGDAQNVFNPRLPAQDRTWETVKTTNFGLEMGFFQNRLSAEFDIYKKRNNDMLIGIEVPTVIGVSVPTGNYGSLETKGWELSLGWNDNIEKIGLKYSFGVNLYDQRDKIISLTSTFSGLVAGIQNLQGYSVNSIFGYQANGYFQSDDEVKSAPFQHARTGAGDVRYTDLDGDGKVTRPNDLKHLGTTTPRYVFGVNMRAELRNFDISAIFQGVGKRNYYLEGRAVKPFINNFDNNSYAIHQDYWTPDNQNALFPRPIVGGGWNYDWSSKWLQNAAYIRMKNLQVGYTISPKILNNKTVRFYFSGENLFKITNLIMFDPEVNNTDGAVVYPLNKSFTVGLNLSF